LPPVSAAVNQISEPSGDQASPLALAKTGVSVDFFPARSTRVTAPPSSPSTG